MRSGTGSGRLSAAGDLVAHAAAVRAIGICRTRCERARTGILPLEPTASGQARCNSSLAGREKDGFRSVRNRFAGRSGQRTVLHAPRRARGVCLSLMRRDPRPLPAARQAERRDKRAATRRPNTDARLAAIWPGRAASLSSHARGLHRGRRRSRWQRHPEALRPQFCFGSRPPASSGPVGTCPPFPART